jgi:hypothetical protein
MWPYAAQDKAEFLRGCKEWRWGQLEAVMSTVASRFVTSTDQQAVLWQNQLKNMPRHL